MNDKTYRILLITLGAVCLLLTVAHLVYAALAYPNSSVIQFILAEWW